MSFSYDLSSNIGKVRLLTTDTDYDNTIFSDEEISAFLEFEDSDVNLASARAFETIAASEVLVQKKIKLLDLTTDGPAVAAALRESADKLREQSESESDIDIIEWGLTTFNRRDIIINDAISNE